MALPALWKGILYDETARSEVADLFDPLVEADHRDLIETCYRDGIHGQSTYGPVADLGAELIEIASSGLQRIAECEEHPPETDFLTALSDRLRSGRSWADELRSNFEHVDGDLLALAKKWAL